MSAYPDLSRIHDLVTLGAVIDGFLEEIGEFRPGEAWEDCGQRVKQESPDLADWLRQADHRWQEIESSSGAGAE